MKSAGKPALHKLILSNAKRMQDMGLQYREDLQFLHQLSQSPLPHAAFKFANKLDANAAVYDILRNRLLIDIELPPMGWRTLAVRPRLREYEPNPQPKGERSFIAAQNGTLENEFLRVQIHPNGTLDLTDKQTGRTARGLHVWTDDASTGNAHKHSGVLRDTVVSSLCEPVHLTLIENNALRATWQIDLTLPVPECAQGNDRSRNTVPVSISTRITLAKGARRLEFKTVIDNKAKDHRLRLLFPTEIHTDFAYADSPFDVIKRCILWNDTKDNMEPHHPFQPMQRFVTVSDGKAGFSFMSKGIGEYEVFDDAARTLAVTMLRTTRVSMKANRGKMTPEELDRSNGHQLQGRYEYEYAVALHNGNWSDAGIHLEADDFRTPVRVLQGVPKSGNLPPKQSLLELSENRKVQISALYRTADGATVLRLWNSASEPVETKLTLHGTFQTLEQINLDESPAGEEFPILGNSATLRFRPLEIQTLRFK